MNIVDDKPIEKLYWSIREVAEMFYVSNSLLRYWEEEFDILHSKKDRKGNRFYTKEDIATVRLIHSLVKIEMYTLAGARRQLLK